MTGKMVAAAVTQMIRMCFSPYIHHVIGELPTYGYRRYGRCFADRPNLMVCLRSMPNVFTGSCARMRCCLSENRCTAIETGTYWRSGRESNQRWCSDGFEFRCDNGENCESRSRWTAVTVRHCTGQSLRAASTVETVQDVMLGAVERRFGNSFRRLQ